MKLDQLIDVVIDNNLKKIFAWLGDQLLFIKWIRQIQEYL